MSNNAMFTFKVMANLRYGASEGEKLGQEIRNLGFSTITAIVDSGVFTNIHTKRALQSIEQEGISLNVFKNTAVEPDYDYLDSFTAQIRSSKSGALIGIGGGSTLDLTKGVATLLTNPGPAIAYRGFPELKSRPLPVIAVPTTAGTGSEVTYNAVFTDNKEKKKLGINSEYNYPVLAVLDPLFTLDCPKSVTISAGMDALTHSLESFAHRNHTPLSRVCSKEAFRFLFNNLMVILDRSDDVETRGNLQLGAYLAGIALINAGSGPAGALSYPLGVHYKVPHGMAGAVFLTSIVEFNVGRGYQDYAELYDLIDGSVKELSLKEKNAAFVDCLRKLDEKLGIPKKLAQFGLGKEDARFLIEQYYSLEKAIAQNPVPMTQEDIAAILNRMA